MDAPLRSLYAQGEATWNGLDGAVARLELGVHPWQDVSAYAAGTWDRNGLGAEAGVRFQWAW